MTYSATMSARSTPSWLKRNLRAPEVGSVCGKACANISSLPQINRIGRHGDQDNCALDGLLPVRLRMEEDQRGGDRPEEEHAHERADQRAAAAGDRHAAHHHRGDHLELEARALV